MTNIPNSFRKFAIMIKTFYFNDLRTCCYVLWDDTKECVIVDAGCYSESEKGRLAKFVYENGLKPVKLLQTHGHFDHVMGCMFARKQWDIPAYMNHGDIPQVARASSYGGYFGYSFEDPGEEFIDLKDGDEITFGHTALKVLHTPGHSKGGVVYYNEAEKYVITGDSLFAQSIGRTDLPGGDLDELMVSLKNKILALPEETKVYPGHGPATDIATEKQTNPFMM